MEWFKYKIQTHFVQILVTQKKQMMSKLTKIKMYTMRNKNSADILSYRNIYGIDYNIPIINNIEIQMKG